MGSYGCCHLPPPISPKLLWYLHRVGIKLPRVISLLGLSQPPQDVDQLTHPLDTAGGAVSGNPGSPSRSNAKSAQNWPQIWNFGTLEVSLRRSAADDDHISGVGGCDIDCMS